VLRALDEFDQIGRARFLAQYGFSKARSYFVVRDGRAYDSKAIAGAAHGYQHPNLGPLRPADFSGGDDTVRAQLAGLGFQVVVAEPANAPPRALVLFDDYSRREVHDMFAPETPFTRGAGDWGLAGILEPRLGEFVLFVSYGRKQSNHRFDEGVTAEGVVTWQSQPGQVLADPQVRRLIDHDSELSNVRLFLRTRSADSSGEAIPYTYLGRVSYLSHDSERERPVFFQWQLIDDWPPPMAVLSRTGLVLEERSSLTGVSDAASVIPEPTLVEMPPPQPPDRRGRRTADFRARKSPDRSHQDAKNRALGLAGEEAVLESERQRLSRQGRPDLAARVRHVSVLEGDGTGFDVASFELDGAVIYIEVKTTRGDPDTAFFVSLNEVDFSKRYAPSYRLYRVYDFQPEAGRGAYWVWSGSLERTPGLHLEAVQFLGRLI
jgi:Protein NO VEIN, C-terminal/Domain of unknown function (DUF3427)